MHRFITFRQKPKILLVHHEGTNSIFTDSLQYNRSQRCITEKISAYKNLTKQAKSTLIFRLIESIDTSSSTVVPQRELQQIKSVAPSKNHQHFHKFITVSLKCLKVSRFHRYIPEKTLGGQRLTIHFPYQQNVQKSIYSTDVSLKKSQHKTIIYHREAIQSMDLPHFYRNLGFGWYTTKKLTVFLQIRHSITEILTRPQISSPYH